MNQKKRAASPESQAALTKDPKELSLKHFNRISKKSPLSQMQNQAYTFYIDKFGTVIYEKKNGRN